MTRSRWGVGVGLVMAAVLGGCRTAGTTTEVRPAAAPQPTVVTGSSIKEGTRLVAQLDQAIGGTAQTGAMYTASVVEPVVDEQGRDIIPTGARLQGRILDAKKASGDEPASVSLSVESLAVNGAEHPIAGHIVATDVDAPRKGIDKKYLLGGGAGGAILGGILGGWKGALIGGAVGAAGGTAVSLGLEGKEANLPQGTALAVQIDKPISVASLRRPGTM